LDFLGFDSMCVALGLTDFENYQELLSDDFWHLKSIG
jgi:hypothetical protein